MMKPIKKIQEILNQILSGPNNNEREFYINTIHNEFLIFDGEIEIPRISVKELDYKNAIPIIKELANYIPDYLYDHVILKEKNPASEQHYLHFIKRIHGKHINFIHMFKVNFKFGGDPANITQKGDPDNYPSYKTNRIYYKSRLIPEEKLNLNSKEDSFYQIKIVDKKRIESDELYFTSAIFDEMNESEITLDFCKNVDMKKLNKSYELYPFIVFDYFTACMNVLDPKEAEIKEAVEIFEPLFLSLFSKYKNYKEIISPPEVKRIFLDELKTEDNKLIFCTEFEKKLKSYFNRYSLSRNDDLSLKGWWKFEKNN